jgi:hypothetical protein
MASAKFRVELFRLELSLTGETVIVLRIYKLYM